MKQSKTIRIDERELSIALKELFWESSEINFANNSTCILIGSFPFVLTQIISGHLGKRKSCYSFQHFSHSDTLKRLVLAERQECRVGSIQQGHQTSLKSEK